ncbi:MAG TPA: hypothetical protein VFU21_06465 [Kofleriaceae bacterium]|nr:hypothetical protein [Kofleriaceae bacterium]
MSKTSALLIAAVVALAPACGGPGAREIVGLEDVPGGSDAPKIAKVTDLGDVPALPPRGDLPVKDSDGKFAVGELVLIEGSGFGKLPSVKIGGAPLAIEARTGNGGVVGRIPAGIDSGAAEVTVSSGGGRDATTIEVERHGLLVDRATGNVHVVAFGADDRVAVRASFAMPGAVATAFAPGGGIAYVAANPPSGSVATVHVIAMTAAGGPKLLRQRHLPIPRVSAIATARSAPVGAVAGSGKLVVLDLSVPRGPTPGTPFPLVGDGSAVAVHPKGIRAVVLSPRDNHLTPVDLARPAAPRVEQPVDLLPGEREPMSIDVEFAPGGDEAWAVVGDRKESVAGGTHPTRLVVISWETGEPKVLRAAELGAAGAPLAVGIGQTESIGSGTAIRSTRRRAPIVVATVNQKLWSDDPENAPSKLQDLGQLVAADLDGKAQVLLTQTSLFGDPQVTPDLAWVISPTVRLARHEGGTRFELGLTFQPLPGTPGGARFTPITEATPAGLKTPPAFALAP